MSIRRINDYLKEHLWMDFEVTKIGMNVVELHGFLDEIYEDNIIIRFKEVYMVNVVMRFSYEGDGDFLSVISGNQAYTLNCNFDVPTKNKIFCLSKTSVPTEMFIIAKKIEMEVFN